ncbi:LacI family DNA-binding transcriptional regulator [Paenibacillus eucommiae]|uniref:DNA-binding LacI/PurR family transcriptional regulator n=1 Tax=Paenibacillus eucommiae TaxID=1355755 RepID=A0ABS4ILU1_9BACL|nr:LacI family DNA-binding transcriptional regulator [Paenibacillus eucommiae]MBP1988537.1 DNA-binding LacI/PurR family transcriptional regulator [Paenibacillus eucommiae]
MTVRKQDIAEYLGVSRATVSLALNNTPGSTISQETRSKILRAAKELGYKDLNATPKIGFLLYNRTTDDPRYVPDLSTTEKAVRDVNYNFMFMAVSSLTEELYNLQQFLSAKELKGVIVTGDIDEAITKVIVEADIPYVFFGGNARDNLHIVLPDHRKGGYEAAKHLIGLGHREIALLCGILDLDVHRCFLEGYQQALEENGIPFNKELVQVSNQEDGYEMCGRMHFLNINYSAAICSNTIIQFGALQRLREMRVSVPQDKSLIGYGYTQLMQASIPQLSTVYLDFSEKSRMVRRLLAVINDPARPKEILYLDDMRLFEGGTCALHV